MDFFFSKDDYNTLFTQIRMDHSKFEDIEKGLKGEVIINNLSNDFNILDQFQVIKSNLPLISISSCVELQVLLREVMDYEIPSQSCWDQVKKLGRMKYTAYQGLPLYSSYDDSPSLHQQTSMIRDI